MTAEDDTQKTAPLTKVIILFASVIGIIIPFAAITVAIAISQGKWRSFTWLMNGEQPFTFRALFLGMLYTMAFGFIDNAGLFFGMDALDKFLPGRELTRAGWGQHVH